MLCALILLTAAVAGTGAALAQDSPAEPSENVNTQAQVRVDGMVLFKVIGVSSYPATTRARAIEQRIKTLAKDESIPVETIIYKAAGDDYNIIAGDQVLVRLVEADATLENIPLPLLAEIVSVRTRTVVNKYRADRTPQALRRSALYSAGLTVALGLLIWALTRLRKWLERVVRQRVDTRMESLERKSGSAFHRGHLWGLAQGLLHILWILVLLVIGYFYLSSVLGTLPWSRGIALLLLEYIKSPLITMGNALVRSIPNLMFLVVLWFVVRFLLRSLGAFFRSVASGRVQLANFEREWAMPTYRLLRLAVIAFALVVAYPYIPGSESAAFKGVSLFLGVIVSLGSTSFIANLIAGTALTYRGVFRKGDWVKIGDAEGRVEEIRAQLVRLRTRSNELISIPSSTILNANVINLSDKGEGSGIVLRCPVGIGYDVSWETVEKLLLAAARDTEGVMPEPQPVVQTIELENFAVAYALLVRVADPATLPTVRTRLNRAILDQFHGAGVQIMSPSYENDPATPKIPAGH